MTVWLSVQDCWTALISAAKEGHIEVVRELLENNANPEHRDMVGTSYSFVLFLLLVVAYNQSLTEKYEPFISLA